MSPNDRVLIASAQINEIEMIRVTLGTLGVRFVTSVDGPRGAWSHLRECSDAAEISAIFLSAFDGTEAEILLSKLSLRAGLAEVPVLIIETDDPGRAASCLQLGAFAVLAHPLRADHVRRWALQLSRRSARAA